MARPIAPKHACVILDACCVINLYASGHMAAILESLAQTIAVATFVRDNEARRIGGRIVGGVAGPDEAIDLQPLVDRGLLTIVQPQSDDENSTYVTFAADLRDDGEAVTGAIALHRRWAIGIDDRRSRNYFARETPDLQLISTPKLLRHWIDTTQPAPTLVREALQDVRMRARYAPGAGHSLYGWWHTNERA